MADVPFYERKRRLIRKARTEGAEKAFEANLALCRDPDAAASARVSAAIAIFRGAGLYERGSADAAGDKSPEDMNPAEFDRWFRAFARQQDAQLQRKAELNRGADIAASGIEALFE